MCVKRSCATHARTSHYLIVNKIIKICFPKDGVGAGVGEFHRREAGAVRAAPGQLQPRHGEGDPEGAGQRRGGGGESCRSGAESLQNVRASCRVTCARK